MLYVLGWCVGLVYCTDVLFILDWCVVCTGLVCCNVLDSGLLYWTDVLVCYMYWIGAACTGLICCMYWSGVMYILDCLLEVARCPGHYDPETYFK